MPWTCQLSIGVIGSISCELEDIGSPAVRAHSLLARMYSASLWLRSFKPTLPYSNKKACFAFSRSTATLIAQKVVENYCSGKHDQGKLDLAKPSKISFIQSTTQPAPRAKQENPIVAIKLLWSTKCNLLTPKILCPNAVLRYWMHLTRETDKILTVQYFVVE